MFNPANSLTDLINFIIFISIHALSDLTYMISKITSTKFLGIIPKFI